MINVAIVGAGKLGFRVAEALLGGDYAITIIDKDEEVLSKLSQQLDVMTISADARDTGVLKNIDIQHFNYLLASTDNDEVIIVIAAFAEKLAAAGSPPESETLST